MLLALRTSDVLRPNPVFFCVGLLVAAAASYCLGELLGTVFDSWDGFADLVHGVGFWHSIRIMLLIDPFSLFGADKSVLAKIDARDVFDAWRLLFALGMMIFYAYCIVVGLSLAGIITRFKRVKWVSKALAFCFAMGLMVFSSLNMLASAYEYLSWCTQYNKLSHYRSEIVEKRSNGVISEGEYRLRHTEALIHQDALTHCLGYPWEDTSRTYVSRLPYVIAADFERYTEGPEALVRRLELICRTDLADRK